jgi:flavin-dependent dehydrogenase
LNSHPLTPWVASAPVAAGGVMLVGDAMGADGLTGEGISVALSHGVLAGRALVESRMDPCRSVLTYERLIRTSPTTTSLRNDRCLSLLMYGKAGATLIASGLTAAKWIRS